MTRKRLFAGWSVLALALCLGVAPATHSARGQEPVRSDVGGRNMTPEANSATANQGEKDENEALLHSASVKKIAQMTGMKVETASTLFTVFNFAILAIAIGAFLLKALPKILRDRSSSIQKDLADARSATEEAGARLNSVEARLSHLDEQILAMKAEAEKDAEAEEKRLKAAAEEERNHILESATQEIAAATQQAHRQLQQYAAGLAIEQAARRLVISAETDRLLVKNFAQRLGEPRGGEN